MRSSPRQRAECPAGFTLVEMLVAITILVILLVSLFSVSAGVANIWKSSTGKVSGFQNARSAFSTLNATLGRATLNTYSDYVDGTGAFRNTTNTSSFVPTQFARASELHFLSGPTADIAKATQLRSASGPALNINATPEANPGHAVFFQAPLGGTNTSDYVGLRRAMNSIGFYVQYGPPDTNLIPEWLSKAVGTKAHRFRLVHFVEPTEALQIYASTSESQYYLDWLNFAGQAANTRVLAEDVLLLILRPRLSPTDEATLAGKGGLGPYAPADQPEQFGSILCPNYHYDSRAWQVGYPKSGLDSRVNAAPYAPKRIQLMQNQLPPIIDVAMVCADAPSLARFDNSTSAPPAAVIVPATLFVDSSKMEQDLTTYANQLSAARIRFHIQRAAIGIQSAKWSNN